MKTICPRGVSASCQCFRDLVGALDLVPRELLVTGVQGWSLPPYTTFETCLHTEAVCSPHARMLREAAGLLIPELRVFSEAFQI